MHASLPGSASVQPLGSLDQPTWACSCATDGSLTLRPYDAPAWLEGAQPKQVFCRLCHGIRAEQICVAMLSECACIYYSRADLCGDAE